MRYSPFCALALVGSASAFLPAQPSPFRTQSTATSFVQEAAESQDNEVSQSFKSQHIASTLTASALAFLLATNPTPANAATSTAPAVPVSAEKKAFDTAKLSVTTQSKRLADLTKAIKDEKLVDSKAAAAEKKMEAAAVKAKTNFDRENTYLLNLPPQTPSISLQAQKSKVDEVKARLDEASKELSAAKITLKTEDAKLAKLTKDYDSTKKALDQSEKDVKTSEKKYKEYLKKTAKQQRKLAQQAKKAEAKKAKDAAAKAKKAASAAKKKQAQQAKKAKDAAAKAKKAEAAAKKKLDQQSKKAAAVAKQKQAKEFKKAKDEAAKAAKAKADKVKKLQSTIESLEKEKRNLVLKGAPQAKVTATETKLKEAKNEMMAAIKSK